MRSMCKGCRIVALDLLDQHRAPDYINRFYRALNRRDRAAAALVGIHNYAETNRGIRGRTDRIIKAVRRWNPKATFWFTETGGIVKSSGWSCSPARAATALQRMFTLAKTHRRNVRRVYAYSFFGEKPGCHRRDYGMVTWNGSKRKGYNVFARLSRGFAR
jgi:hypothetical protein